MAKKQQEFLGVGRRKEASARVRLTPGKGKVTANKREFEDYFPQEALRGYILQPLMMVGAGDSYDIKARLSGGGVSGQAGALRHGIARALVEANPDYRSTLKESGMLTRDARVKERKKYGQPGARKRFQFSKR